MKARSRESATAKWVKVRAFETHDRNHFDPKMKKKKQGRNISISKQLKNSI